MPILNPVTDVNLGVKEDLYERYVNISFKDKILTIKVKI